MFRGQLAMKSHFQGGSGHLSYHVLLSLGKESGCQFNFIKFFLPLNLRPDFNRIQK